MTTTTPQSSPRHPVPRLVHAAGRAWLGLRPGGRHLRPHHEYGVLPALPGVDSDASAWVEISAQEVAGAGLDPVRLSLGVTGDFTAGQARCYAGLVEVAADHLDVIKGVPAMSAAPLDLLAGARCVTIPLATCPGC